jgi:hypothetical protein
MPGLVFKYDSQDFLRAHVRRHFPLVIGRFGWMLVLDDFSGHGLKFSKWQRHFSEQNRLFIGW